MAELDVFGTIAGAYAPFITVGGPGRLMHVDVLIIG